MPLPEKEIIDLFRENLDLDRGTLAVLQGFVAQFERVHALNIVLVEEVAALAAAREGIDTDAVVRRIDSRCEAILAALVTAKISAPAS